MPFDFTKHPWEQVAPDAAGKSAQLDVSSRTSWRLVGLLLGALVVLGVIFVRKFLPAPRKESRREPDPLEKPWWDKFQ